MSDELPNTVQTGDKASVLALLQADVDVNNYTQDGRTALTKAAEIGNTNLLQLLLEHGADVNRADVGQHTKGCTALMWAAYSGSYGSVKLLLASGADVNAKNIAGITPLMWAAYKGHTLVARLLLRWGAWINAQDASGSTPLIEAVRGGRDMMVFLLLKSGANTTGQEGLKALRTAQSYGYRAIARHLQEVGIRLSCVYKPET